MKNTLSENMLRFGTKNLSVSAQKELIVKSIMETIDQHMLHSIVRHRLTEAPVAPYDPWLMRGGMTWPMGFKFKSQENYETFIAPPNAKLTTADQKGAPSLFIQDPKTKQFVVKNPGGASNTTYDAGMNFIGSHLFIIAAAAGLKNLVMVSTPTGLNNIWGKVAPVINKIFSPKSGIGSAYGMVEIITDPANKQYADFIKAWSYIVSTKLQPIYMANVAAYVVMPKQ